MNPLRIVGTLLRLDGVGGAAILWMVCGLAGFRVVAAPSADQTVAAMRLIKAECFSCHSQEKKKGGLVLTSRERLLEGGDSGVAVAPGKPDASLLAKLLVADADPHMPPKKQLLDAQIKIVRDWIKGGVKWNQAALDEEETILSVSLGALPASYQPVLALALSPDGKRLAVGRGGSLLVHDVSVTNFPALAEVAAHRDAVQCLAWSSDGRWLASGGFRRLALWNAETLQLEREWTNGLAGRITVVRFSTADDQLLVADSVGGQGGFVRVFNRTEAKSVASWRAHEDTIFDFDLSQDGKQLVTAGGDKLIKVWDVTTRKETARLEGHSARVLSVAFNTNATQVVSGGADKQLKVWDIETRHPTSSLGKHASAISAVAWRDEGKVIVAATDGGALVSYKNLKAHTGRESSESGDEKKLGEAGDVTQSLAVSADAKRIFAGTHEGAVVVWNGEGKQLAKLTPSANTTDFATATVPTEPRSSRRESALIKSPEKIRADSRRLLQAEKIASLSVEPGEVRLSAAAQRHGVLVTARTEDGFEVDVTAKAKVSASRSAPFEITADGRLLAKRAGEGTLTAQFKGKRVQVPVRVEGAASTDSTPALAAPPVSFTRDVLPALSRAGCSGGSCHAKAEGQNGFKLSVFSYDPKSDFNEIVKEDRGRRVFPAAPEESLLIKKPTGAMPHEGGVRFERGSDTHQMLVRWIQEGMAYSVTNEPTLDRIVAFPKDRRYRKGASQQLLVQAHYSDGSIRDVTRLAAFDSNDKEIAAVDEQGLIAVGSLSGQGVVVARYMGLVADSQILVPADRLLPESQYAALPRNNFIDDLAYAHFQQLGLFPSDSCTDAEFLRRAKLDAIGLLPTPEEVREFLEPGTSDRETISPRPVTQERGEGKGEGQLKSSSPRPSRPAEEERVSKRRAVIVRLLDDPAYADYWANKWADLLRPNPDRVGVKSVFVFDQWLRESFRQNKPYDQFVRDILLAEGSNHRDGPAVVYRDRREPADLTTMFSQLFLGTRLECAKCHHHPNEKWSQDDFYQFAAFFGPVKQKGAGLSPPISGGTETFFFAPGGKGVKHPVSGAVMSPRPLDGPISQASTNTDPRRELVRWLTSSENPFFARAAVNRVWAVFFGRGLVEPVDDFRISNPCVNPPLLDALAADFAKHGYDLKHLMRTIMESRLYQLSSTPNESNVADTRNFSRAYRRRLPAEVLLDAVNDATGVPDTLAALPVGSRATQAWTYKIESPLMDAFNRPNPSSDPPCERDRQMSVVQSLHLANSKALQAKLSHKTGRARQLAESTKSPEEIVTDLYMVALNRPPTAEELKSATTAYSAKDATRQTATEDVFWSLLNSAEFVLNH